MAVAAAISRPLRGPGERTASGSGAQHWRQTRGNTIQEQKPSYTRYYDWDGRDMMVGVRSTEAGGTDNEIRYDGLASRASLLDSGGMTYYLWDGIRVLKTTAGDETLRQRQVHGQPPSGIPSVGDIAMIESSAGDAYTPVADQVGTLWKLIDSTAAVANTYSYDAFGVPRSATETFTYPYRFAGKPLDADTALYYFIARQYKPGLGRFTSRDRVVRQESPYRYANSTPTGDTDPAGLQIAVPEIAKRVAKAMGEWIVSVEIDRIFRKLDMSTAQECWYLHFNQCMVAHNHERRWPTPETKLPGFKEYAECVANALSGLPLFNATTDVSWYADVNVTWYCDESRKTVGLVLSGKLSIAVLGQQQVFWTLISIGSCSSLVCPYSMCCE